MRDDALPTVADGVSIAGVSDDLVGESIDHLLVLRDDLFDLLPPLFSEMAKRSRDILRIDVRPAAMRGDVVEPRGENGFELPPGQ